MTKGTRTDSTAHRLLSVTLPSPAAPSLGDWLNRGLCTGPDPDPDAFFPSHTDPGTRARQACAACPVRGQCLTYATEADEYGIWGGLDQQQRRNLKRRQRRKNAAQPREARHSAGAA
jgi:WhiB family redox-sensing transcriptional regulator